MNYKKLMLFTIILQGLGIGLKAQESVIASGSDTSGNGGSMSYSVGQIFYTSSSGTNNSVVQGVQQPYEISVINGIDAGEDFNITCSVYPNPVKDLVKLVIENEKSENFACQLFDINGRLLEYKKIEGIETSIEMKSLLPSIYFIKVIDNNKEIKTFKIIKY